MNLSETSIILHNNCFEDGKAYLCKAIQNPRHLWRSQVKKKHTLILFKSMTLMAQTWSIWGSLASGKAKISEPRLPTPISTNTRRISENVITHASQKLHKHKLNYTIPLVDTSFWLISGVTTSPCTWTFTEAWWRLYQDPQSMTRSNTILHALNHQLEMIWNASQSSPEI